MTETPEPIRAPWTSEQVDALNQFQTSSGMHPFTCGNHHDGAPMVLIARSDGWHCPQPPCDYRQDWAHAFMTQPHAWPKPFPHNAPPGRTETGATIATAQVGGAAREDGAGDGEALRNVVAEALMRWAEGNNNPGYAKVRRPETVTANAYSRADAVLAAIQDAYVPPPPGSDRDALPDHLRALIQPHMPEYVSTACQTALALDHASQQQPALMATLLTWERRQHAACRLTRKQDMAPCVCDCHQTPNPDTPGPAAP